MTAGEVCNRSVVVTSKDDTIIDAANRMRMFHVGDLVVVEDRQNKRMPVGIITDRDIVVSVVASNADHIRSLRVGDVMSSELLTAREHESTEAALQKMEEGGIRRLPIVDGDGMLVGILTLDDVLRFLTDQQIGLVKLVAQEQRREKQFRV